MQAQSIQTKNCFEQIIYLILSKVYIENVSSIFINKLTKYKINIFFSGFTGYVQRVDRNRKNQRGFTYYFDIILQTAVDQTEKIRIMISSMDDITKSQLFKDKQKAQQPITITNLRVVQSGMVFMHQNSIVKDVSTNYGQVAPWLDRSQLDRSNQRLDRSTRKLDRSISISYFAPNMSYFAPCRKLR